MRVLILLVAFCSAIEAGSQPLLSPEVVAAVHPFTIASRTIAVPAVAIARDRRGLVVAWAQPTETSASRIHVARIDPAGQIEGTIRVLPTRARQASTIASDPSLTPRPGNDGFVLAWLENTDGASWPVVSFLEADLIPSAQVGLSPTSGRSPVIVRSGAAVWVTFDGMVFQVDRDGHVRFLSDRGIAASDAVALATDDLTAVSEHQVTNGFRCNVAPGCSGAGLSGGICWCKIYNYSYVLRLTGLFASADAVVSLSESDMQQPAIETIGDHLLIAWVRGNEVLASVVDAVHEVGLANAVKAPRILGPIASDTTPARPDAASNGRRSMVVWRTTAAKGDHDVVGATIESDGTVTRFDVATSAADERDPAVFAMGGGFLIAYEKVIGGQRSIVWRTVSFPSRRRAVRR